jgi:uncharacterized protein
MANLINWVEIPVTDMARAQVFYQKVLPATVDINDQMAPGMKMGFIQTQGMDMSDVGGALVEGEGYIPGTENTLIYFNANESGGCDAFLKRVEESGGTIIAPAFLISEEIGYCGFFKDSEGNKLAVHSLKN